MSVLLVDEWQPKRSPLSNDKNNLHVAPTGNKTETAKTAGNFTSISWILVPEIVVYACDLQLTTYFIKK
jgi:hypothetical protein